MLYTETAAGADYARYQSYRSRAPPLPSRDRKGAVCIEMVDLIC